MTPVLVAPLRAKPGRRTCSALGSAEAGTRSSSTRTTFSSGHSTARRAAPTDRSTRTTVPRSWARSSTGRERPTDVVRRYSAREPCGTKGRRGSTCSSTFTGRSSLRDAIRDPGHSSPLWPADYCSALFALSAAQGLLWSRRPAPCLTANRGLGLFRVFCDLLGFAELVDHDVRLSSFDDGLDLRTLVSW